MPATTVAASTTPPAIPYATASVGEGSNSRSRIRCASSHERPQPTPSPSKFTFLPTNNAVGAFNALNTIGKAKTYGVPTQLALPCGSHSGDRDANGNFYKLGNCLRDSSNVAVFSRFRFDSAAKATLTPAVVAAIQAGYAAGYISSIQIMDEPWVHGSDDGTGAVVGNTWGPEGTIKRVRADSLCGFVKALVPGVPVGLSDYHAWDAANGLRVCDFGQPQFVYRFLQTNQFASIAAWRDWYLARAAKYGNKVTFSMNWVNGDYQDRTDGVWDCKDQGGVKGQNSPLCQMTPAHGVEVVTVLGDATCGGQMAWRSDDTRFASQAWQDAIRQILAIQAARAYKPCKVR